MIFLAYDTVFRYTFVINVIKHKKISPLHENVIFLRQNADIFLTSGPPLRTLEKINNLEIFKINPFLRFFVKIKTTVEYFNLPSTNTISSKIQILMRNGLILQYKIIFHSYEYPH